MLDLLGLVGLPSRIILTLLVAIAQDQRLTGSAAEDPLGLVGHCHNHPLGLVVVFHLLPVALGVGLFGCEVPAVDHGAGLLGVRVDKDHGTRLSR